MATFVPTQLPFHAAWRIRLLRVVARHLSHRHRPPHLLKQRTLTLRWLKSGLSLAVPGVWGNGMEVDPPVPFNIRPPTNQPPNRSHIPSVHTLCASLAQKLNDMAAMLKSG